MLVREILVENLGPAEELVKIPLNDRNDPEKLGLIFTEQIWPILEKNCSEILKVYKSAGKFLYRGVKAGNVATIKARVRTDRKPRYLHPKLQELADEVAKEMGAKALRGNSLFCSTKEDIAGTWGDAYIVFPRNGFEVTFFEGMKDDYMYSLLAYDVGLGDDDGSADRIEKTKKEIEKLFISKKISTKKSDMAQAMTSKTTEYLIAVDSYFGLNVEFFDDLVSNKLGI